MGQTLGGAYPTRSKPGGYPAKRGTLPGPAGGGYPARSSRGGVPCHGGYPARSSRGVPCQGGTLPGPARGEYPARGVLCQVQLGGYPTRSSWVGYPAGGLLCQVQLGGGYPARSSRGRVPCRGGIQVGVGQQKEYSIHGRRYASCVHAGGISCFIYFRKFHKNWSNNRQFGLSHRNVTV